MLLTFFPLFPVRTWFKQYVLKNILYDVDSQQSFFKMFMCNKFSIFRLLMRIKKKSCILLYQKLDYWDDNLTFSQISGDYIGYYFLIPVHSIRKKLIRCKRKKIGHCFPGLYELEITKCNTKTSVNILQNMTEINWFCLKNKTKLHRDVQIIHIFK